LSELAGLDAADVNLSAQMVRTLGKGGKQRIVPFNTSTAAAIRAYLKDREVLVRDRSAKAGRYGGRNAGRQMRDPLFVNYRGTRLTVRSIDRMVRRYAAGWASARTRCGIPSPRTCSSAAPTFGRFRSCSATRG
jgi:integrase/recombinase XerC